MAVMVKATKISTRIEPELKTKGKSIHRSFGFNPSDARIPNSETVRAMKELKSPETRKKLSKYSSPKELIKDLDS